MNPQVGSGYFSCPVMIYEGDTVSRVVDRIKRKAGTPGVCVCVCVCVCVLCVCLCVCVCVLCVCLCVRTWVGVC